MLKMRAPIWNCAQAFKLMVSCNDFGVIQPFDSSCYSHALLKVCQYAILDEKVVHRLHYASIKYA